MNTSEFYENDYWATLFPMKTNLLMVKHHEKDLSDYIYQKILNDSFPADNFLPQQRIYATKPRGHLRRTVKLDPVAEYFVYDLIYRNRSVFRKPAGPNRESFGYRFEAGNPISVNTAYRAFKSRISEQKLKFKHHISFDIASYFNSIYHHDLAHWFNSHESVTTEDANAISRFLREINAGHSIDFLPHGIYPCKMIGNEFLKSIDLSYQIKSSVMLRLMDDFYLFDDSESILSQDFVKIQQLLGSLHLNVNPMKTRIDAHQTDVATTISEIRKTLYEVVEIEVPIEEVFASGTVTGTETVEIELETNLSTTQVETLLGLLKEDTLEESDADLILAALKSHSDSLLELVPHLLGKFPNITKHLYTICGSITDKELLAKTILDFIKTHDNHLEYQLFWLAVLAEEQLSKTRVYGDILLGIYEMTAEHKIARAKVLEIPEQGFGLKDIRTNHLKTGSSDWLAWASAMGSRTLKPGERNYVLDYFSKGSPLNFLIASCVKKI